MMRRILSTAVLALVPALLQGQALTPAEREPILESLKMTTMKLMHMSEHHTAEEWNWKPAPDRWSLGEVAEHILVTEQGILEALKGPFNESTTSLSEKASMPVTQIAAIMRDRSTKFQAPAQVTPSGRWATPAAWREAFEANRKALIEFAESGADLHGHVLPHPAFGMMDGEQWLAFLAYHTERHVMQAEEVMHDANFPGHHAMDHAKDHDMDHDKAAEHEKEHNEKHE